MCRFYPKMMKAIKTGSPTPTPTCSLLLFFLPGAFHSLPLLCGSLIYSFVLNSLPIDSRLLSRAGIDWKGHFLVAACHQALLLPPPNLHSGGILSLYFSKGGRFSEFASLLYRISPWRNLSIHMVSSIPSTLMIPTSVYPTPAFCELQTCVYANV